MKNKKDLTWQQKSDLESRELFVVRAFDAKSLGEAYKGLLKESDIINEREIIKSFDPMKLSSLVLRGYEAPDFAMRQESNKMIIGAKKILKNLKISKTWTNTFWGFISLQSDTLLEKIEEDLEAVSLGNSAQGEQYKNLLLATYRTLKDYSPSNQSSYNSKVTAQELQLGF